VNRGLVEYIFYSRIGSDPDNAGFWPIYGLILMSVLTLAPGTASVPVMPEIVDSLRQATDTIAAHLGSSSVSIGKLHESVIFSGYPYRSDKPICSYPPSSVA
jgi:hypothetical protein